MSEPNHRLSQLGFSPFFRQQLDLDELESATPARVTEVQRSGVTVAAADSEHAVAIGGKWLQQPPEARPTVGDWVLLNDRHDAIERLLERKSVFRRVAAGTRKDVQLIAANVDTLFVVTSCNDEFNLSRLERYLSLAFEAGVEPVIVLTKSDLADDAEPYIAATRSLGTSLSIECVNALDASTLSGLRAWCTTGQTVALVGSSGVGKSTLVNTLSGAPAQTTRAIRVDDDKGRHTTSSRSLHALPDGGLLLDVPGMRELQVADAEQGIAQMFEDVESLAAQCRFNDCAHESEPDCAVRAAIASGQLDERRLRNYRKLLREEAHNTASLAEQRRRARQFTRMVRTRIKEVERRRDEE